MEEDCDLRACQIGEELSEQPITVPPSDPGLLGGVGGLELLQHHLWIRGGHTVTGLT